MKKKILGIVLSLTMVGAMLAGCGQQQRELRTRRKKPRQKIRAKKIPMRTTPKKRMIRTKKKMLLTTARRESAVNSLRLQKKT